MKLITNKTSIKGPRKKFINQKNKSQNEKNIYIYDKISGKKIDVTPR
jgi:hypothetical protein